MGRNETSPKNEEEKTQKINFCLSLVYGGDDSLFFPDEIIHVLSFLLLAGAEPASRMMMMLGITWAMIVGRQTITEAPIIAQQPIGPGPRNFFLPFLPAHIIFTSLSLDGIDARPRLRPPPRLWKLSPPDPEAASPRVLTRLLSLSILLMPPLRCSPPPRRPPPSTARAVGSGETLPRLQRPPSSPSPATARRRRRATPDLA